MCIRDRDKEHHNAVFVGIDENGVPRQASKRSTNSFGKTFRITCGGSDTRYSFAHFGESEKLFVFEAPIDMLSYLTLNPENWQQHSYIAMNGVYENAVLTALKNHSNLNEIVLCVDNDEGGIEAVDRLKDILGDNRYTCLLYTSDTERLKDKSRIKQAVDSYINVIYNEWLNDGMITKDDLKKYAFLYVYWEDTGDGYYDLYLMW